MIGYFPAPRAGLRYRRALALLVALLAGPAGPLWGQEQPTRDSSRVRIVTIQGRLPSPRPAVVVLPFGYGQDARRYPVLYLLHGLWGGHRDWVDRTNLLEYTASLPAIIVLPDAGDSWYSNSVTRPAAQFEDYIAKDVIAYVDEHFRTLPFPAARFVAGLSMGGYGAFKLALKHPGRFSLVASFSGAFMVPEDTTFTSLREALGPPGSEARHANDVVTLLSQTDLASPPYFYLDSGTSDRLLASNRAVAAALARRGLPYEYHEVNGTHSWEYWNRRLLMVLALVRERVSILP